MQEVLRNSYKTQLYKPNNTHLEGYIQLFDFLRTIFLKVMERIPQGHFDEEETIFLITLSCELLSVNFKLLWNVVILHFSFKDFSYINVFLFVVFFLLCYECPKMMNKWAWMSHCNSISLCMYFFYVYFNNLCPYNNYLC